MMSTNKGGVLVGAIGPTIHAMVIAGVGGVGGRLKRGSICIHIVICAVVQRKLPQRFKTILHHLNK